MATITIPKKEYQKIEIKYPKAEFRNYRKIWQNLEILGKSIEKSWKCKKTALKLLKEARR
ncbi:hypothetical protein KJ636_05585 [Patescibacteria group bacterium]|nr:hypothetical protein [Patescibacteria group bacterium]MBU4481559.1 hypothetical protein [Patescibacteria group bacterium]